MIEKIEKARVVGLAIMAKKLEKKMFNIQKMVRLNHDMVNALGRLAEDEGQPEAVVIRQALSKYFKDNGYTDLGVDILSHLKEGDS